VRITYRYIRPCAVLYAREIGSYATSVAVAWGTMNVWLGERAARQLVRCGYGVFHDDPNITTPDAMRYDACVSFIGDALPDADPAGGIGRQTLAGGAYAVHAHVGAYETAGELLSHLRRDAVVKRGLSIDHGRPYLAIYLNDPQLTREAHRRTELCIPVMPMRMPASSNDEEYASGCDEISGRARA
jgi:AraC family transcriptional regulator